MIKAKHFLVADTETTGVGNRAITFDFGYVIATRKEIKQTRSFLVREVITNPRVMFAALRDEYWRHNFGGKLFTFYIPELSKGNQRIYPWSEIVSTLREDMRRYNVDVFSAYNLGFDMRALAKTQELIKAGGKILEYRPDLLDLWQFACETVCQRPTYHQLAKQEGNAKGWITDANNIRTNAEKVYAYLTGDFDFIESHTALDDALIETEILQRLLATKKAIPYNVMDHMPWRLAQRIN
jgi:hypothetical protein